MSNIRPRFTPEMLLQALPGTGGIRNAIAQKMGCSRTTVWEILKDNPELMDAVYHEEQTIADLAENKLFSEINAGNMTAIIFFLKTKAKDRGYVERFENKMEYNLEELKGMSNDELLSLHKRIKNIK